MQAKPLYEITGENSTIKPDRLTERRSKNFHLSHEGAGQAPQIVWDEVLKSQVLSFRIGPTPSGKIKDRSELAIYSGVEFDKTWALGLKVFVPPGNEITKNWHSLVQCPQGDARSPAFSLSLIAPGQFALVSRSDEDSYKVFGSGDFPLGRWVNLELEFRMGEQGHAKMWLDGKLVADNSAVLRFKSAQPRCNLKVGTYRGKASTPFEVRMDDIRFGTTRAAVVQN